MQFQGFHAKESVSCSSTSDPLHRIAIIGRPELKLLVRRLCSGEASLASIIAGKALLKFLV